MELKKVKIADIIPYENNPRKNDEAVDAVAESIRQCGYCAPIVVDENMVILAGHTRLKALKKLGKDEAEVVIKDGLTEEQKKKYRLLDNKTNEFAEWDFDKLQFEAADLDFGDFDFGFFEKEEKPKEEKPINWEAEYQLIIDCTDEADMNEKYEMLQEIGIECRISTL